MTGKFFLLACLLLWTGCASSPQTTQADEPAGVTSVTPQEAISEPAAVEETDSGPQKAPESSETAIQEAPAEPVSPADTAAPPATEPQASPSAESDKEVLAKLITEAEEMQATVETLRGLKFKYEVPKKVVNTEEWNEYVKKSIEEELPDEEVHGYSKTLKKLCLVPEDYDLRTGLTDLVAEQAAAFYDPEKKYLAFINSKNGGMKGISQDQANFLSQFGISALGVYVVHELTHALEDQYFDMKKFLADGGTNDDTSMAAASVIEGNATFIMYEYPLLQAMKKMQAFDNLPDKAKEQVLGPIRKKIRELLSGSIDDFASMMPSADAQVFNEAPRFIKETLVFPYFKGYVFAAELYELGGPEFLDAVYKDTPQSTEQVLHPEKFFGNRDFPTQIELPDFANMSSFKQLYKNTLGEFAVRHIIMGFFDDPKVHLTASAGWDGDQYVTYEDPQTGAVSIIWLSCWDTLKDAREFYSTYKLLLHKKYKDDAALSQKEEPGKTIIRWTTSTGALYLERRDNAVLVIEGIPESSIEETAGTAWKYTQKELVKEVKVKK